MRRLDVFGRAYVAERTVAGWVVYAAGAEGKRGSRLVPSIPSFVQSDDELLTYLADLFHEAATPERSEVRWLD